MAKITLPTLVACAVIAIAASAGCQKQFYASGIGGNLVPVKDEPDGARLYVPYDQVEKYKQAEKAKSDSALTATPE